MRQRARYGKGRLVPYRKVKLDEIGFVWRLKKGKKPGQWMKMHNKLKQFKVRLHV